jgi:hypothetical protein
MKTVKTTVSTKANKSKVVKPGVKTTKGKPTKSVKPTKGKRAVKQPNWFVRVWRKIVKFFTC